MFRLMIAAAAVALLTSQPLLATATSYELDPHHTEVRFSWNHFGYSNPSGSFNDLKGTLVFDDAEPANSSIKVTIPVSSINTRVAELDAHLLRDDFLDAVQFADITFTSTSVEPAAGDNAFKVNGDLTIHGVTQPVTLDATLNKRGGHPMSKAPTIGFDATTSIKRSDFGVGKFAPMVSDELKVTITLEASAKVETPEAD